MNDLSKDLVCILLRLGIEIWVEKEKAEKLISALTQKDCPQFIYYEDKVINKSDISGVFTAKDMAERIRRKNGEWKCEHGNWIPRYKKCQCSLRPEYRDY